MKIYSLSGAVLFEIEGADLYGADLYGASLNGANLTRANLTRANLTGADLNGANLTRANLTRANLTGADLTGADLYGADLTGADLTGADLYGADLTGADLTGATMPDGRKWEDFSADPLDGICSDLDARSRAISAWGNHSWSNCPMHSAYGWNSIYDAPEEKRKNVAAFIAVFDAKLLSAPKTQEAKS